MNTLLKKGDKLTGYGEAAELFIARIGALEHEELHALFLDADNVVITVEMLAKGGESSVSGPSAQSIADRARELGARKFIVSHNHPGTPVEQKPIPSYQDIQTTIRIGAYMAVDGLNLLDHIVVGPGKATSIRFEVMGDSQS